MNLLESERQLRDKRAANGLIVESVREGRLKRWQQKEARRADLLESLNIDWVTPYMDLLDRFRQDPVYAGPSAYWNRRYGKNFPIFQTETDLSILRAPARILCATNGFAIGTLEGLTSYVIGQGFTYRTKIRDESDAPEELAKACQAVIDRFHKRSQWYGGEMPGLEEELFWRSCEDGEFFLDHTCMDDGHTEVRTVEPEQVTQPPQGDPFEWMFGIRTDVEDVQKPLGYWIYWGNTPVEGDEYSPDDIVHFRRNTKRSIKRGLTDFSFDTLETFEHAARLRTNMGDAGAQQASIVGVRQHEAATGQDIQQWNQEYQDWQSTDPITSKTEPVRQYKKGGWEDIPKGMNYVPGPIAQSQPIHIQVLQMCLRSCGQRWNAPEWLPSADASNNNYASSLTAESPFVKTVLRRQKNYGMAFTRTHWIVLKNWWTKRGIYAAGREWSWDEIERAIDISAEAVSPEVRDRNAEANKAAIEIPLGVDSRQRYAQSQGRDFAQIAKDNEQYAAEFGGNDQQLPMPGADETQQQQPPQPQQQPQNEGNDGGGNDNAKPAAGASNPQDKLAGDLGKIFDALKQAIPGVKGPDNGYVQQLAQKYLQQYQAKTGRSAVESLLEDQAGKSGVFKDQQGKRYRLERGKRVPLGDSSGGEPKSSLKAVSPEEAAQAANQFGQENDLGDSPQWGKVKTFLAGAYVKATTAIMTAGGISGVGKMVLGAIDYEPDDFGNPAMLMGEGHHLVGHDPLKDSTGIPITVAARAAGFVVGQIIKRLGKGRTESVDPFELKELVRRTLLEILREPEFGEGRTTLEAVDAAGHAHKGKGEGGGQFTKSDAGGSSGTDGSLSSPDNPGYKKLGKEALSNQKFREDLFDSLEEQGLYDEHKDGLIEMPRLFKEMQKRRPDMSLTEFHAALDQARSDSKVELHQLNETRLAKNKDLAIERNDKLFYYVRLKSAVKSPDGLNPDPNAKPTERSNAEPAKPMPSKAASAPQEPKSADPPEPPKAATKQGNATNPAVEKPPALPAGVSAKTPDNPAYKKLGCAAMDDPGFRKDFFDSMEEQGLYVEHQDGLIRMPQLFKEMQKRRPDMTLDQFHAALDAARTGSKVELHTLNEVKDAKNKDLAIERNDRLLYFVRLKRDVANPNDLKLGDS